MAKKYYSLDNMKKTNCQYRMLLGEKSNGKSYAVKSELIKDYWENGRRFVYMRRYREDLKTVDIEAYFSDAPVEKITKGKYHRISVYQGNIYLSNYDEKNDKFIKGDCIGRAVYLSGYEHFASQAFPDTYNIVFEEFITQGLYINGESEPGQMMKMCSTILRDREGCAVYLVGNTINRVCPYFTAWGLTHTVKQKQGTIEIYKFHRQDADGNDIVTAVAVEMCESSNSSSSMFFGRTAEFIVQGKWETYEKPALPGNESDFTTIYELIFEDMGFAFILQLKVNNESGGQFIYCYPFTGKRRIQRKITQRFSDDPFITTCFNPKIKAEVTMRDLLRTKKICYSDNLTGTDFESVLDQWKGVL